MKVYELITALMNLPSGADVICGAIMTVNELKSGGKVGVDDDGTMYAVNKPLVEVDYNDKVYLNFRG